MPPSTITKTSVVPLPIQSFTQAERTGENVEVNNLLKRIENKQQSAINELSGVMNQFVIPAIMDRQQQLQLPPPQLSETPMQIKRMGRPSGSKNKPKARTQEPSPQDNSLINQPENTDNDTIYERVPAAKGAIEGNNIPNQIDEALNINSDETKQPEEDVIGGKKSDRPKKISGKTS